MKNLIIITVLLLAVSAWAGMDCKCVDGKKQCTSTKDDNYTISKKGCCDRVTEYKKAVFLVSEKENCNIISYGEKCWGESAHQVDGYVSREYCKNPQFVHISVKSQFLDSNKNPFPKDYIIWDYREVE